MSLLLDIVRSKRKEIAEAGGSPAVGASDRTPKDVLARLRRSEGAPLRLLAEIKYRSPSAGALDRTLDTAARALSYARAGAAMVSVLCDAPFFGGSYGELALARAALPGTPLLAKEFVLEPIQLEWARAHGADAALVIARIVDPKAMRSLVARAMDLGLEPIVEVADEPELEHAVAAGARVIGVNARDLDTLVMDAARAARVLEKIPAGTVALYLSGVKTPDDVRALAHTRADGALVGEVLMRQADPAPLLSELVAAANR